MFKKYQVAYLIAKRMRGNVDDKGSVSSRIIVIATIAVVIGIVMILVAVATGKGMQKKIQEKAVAFNGHVLVSALENQDQELTVYPIKTDDQTVKVLNSHPKITEYYPFATKAGMLQTDTDFEGIVLKGVDSTFNWDPLADFLVEGKFPKIGSIVTNQILLSQTIASRLKLEVGDYVNAYFQYDSSQRFPNRRRFEISGIYSSGFSDIDENLILGDIRHIQRINRWTSSEIGGYQVFLDDFDQTSIVSEALYYELPATIGTTSLISQYGLIFQWIALFDFNILIIIVIMVIVGVMNMSTALLALIFERTRMIGMLKALGMLGKSIQHIFLINGLLIMGRGLLIGNFLVLLFYLSQKQWGWIKLDPHTYFVSTAPVSLTVFDVLGINALFLIVCTLLLWIPSAMVLRVAPAKIMRV